MRIPQRLHHTTSSRILTLALRRVAIAAALLLCVALPAVAQTANGYVIYQNGNFLTHDPSSGDLSTTATTKFNPSTCLWAITTSNGNTYIRPVSSDGTTMLGSLYLRPRNNNNSYNLNTNASANYAAWTGASNGSMPYYGSYYIQNNNGTWRMRYSTTNRATIYSVTKNTVAASTTVSVPTIDPHSSQLNINDSQSFTASATATTTPAYETYTFNTNTTVYYFNGTAYTSENAMKASSDWTSATSAPTIEYAWSLTGGANANLSLDSNTANPVTVSYTSAANANASSTLSVTVSATANGKTGSNTSSSNATISVVPPVNPNSISITTTSPATVYVGSAGMVAYTLNPTGAYDNVTGVSSRTDVFTVGTIGNGTATINPVATGSAILTLTAHNLNNEAIASATITVTVKDKVATPVITFTPDADDYTKATATISCTTQGTTIYYKVNTDAYAEFTSDFEVNEDDVVSAYAVKTSNPNNLWDDSEVATDTYVSCSTGVPTISYKQNGTTATVTITAEAGATIYYTTNGNDPTTGSASGISPLTINNVGNCTIKAIAKNVTCQASDPVSKEIILTGTFGDGTTVTLYDLEDHTWTYYSGKPDTDYPDALQSADPRNVKITYYANGYRHDGNTFTAVTDVQLSYNETANTFVYYETIEKEPGGQILTGNYPYKVIPNPFSKRPKDGNTYYGFEGWRIKSGGDKIANYNNNDILPLEQVINFINLDNGYAPNVISAEIELEAIWAPATVVTNATNGLTAAYSYERNFIVCNTNMTISGLAQNATVSSRYPDGSAYGNDNTTITAVNNNNTADIKVEHIKVSGTFNGPNNKWLIVGRGCEGEISQTLGQQNNIKFRLESGTHVFVHPRPNTTGIIVMGSDYDRATKDNNRLRVVNYVTATGSGAPGSNSLNEFMDITIKSGYFGYKSEYDDPETYGNYGLGVGGNTDNINSYTPDPALGGSGTRSTYSGTSSGSWQQTMSFYCGGTRGGGTGGKIRVLIEGGELSSLNGGGCKNSDANKGVIMHYIRMKGGWVKGALYGTASASESTGSTKLVITGGEVNGWVAGACNGTRSDGNYNGELNGNCYIYVGGNAELRSHNNDGVYNNAWGLVFNVQGGTVFGAGKGIDNSQNHVGSADETFISVSDNAYIEQAIYGGAFHGIAKESHIYLTGDARVGNVYGGSFEPVHPDNEATWRCNNTDIRMYDGNVLQGIYGGHNAKGTVYGSTTLHIDGGQVGTSNSTANIHGGGYGQNTRVNGNVDLTLGTSTQTTPGVTVYGDVYGGSALGTVNTNASNHTNVTLNKGIINGSLYGGGLGDNSTAANVNGPVTVTVNGGTVNTTSANGSGAVYGCNNLNGAPQNTVAVIINGTDPAPGTNAYALDAVYGGGNQANYTYGTPTVTVNNCDNSIAYVYGGGNAAHITNGNTDVTIYGGNKIGHVFGGGNGQVEAANISGNTNVKIYGGTIGQVFGGSNTQGTIGGTISVLVNKTGSCPMHIDEVYGGGNMAASKAGSISIGCTGGADEGIGDVYGGANAADITGNIALNIAGGSIQRLFGGNNASGNISGSITVNVDWDTNNSCGNNYLGTVYGGGNQAAYSPTTVDSYPAVNIKNGTVSGSVFGGGLGSTAVVTSNPVVKMTGGQAANVYGGGMQADVNGNTTVSIENGTVTTDVYGGGMQADVSGNVTVNISKSGTPGTVIIGRDVYGGGALANTNTGNIDSETTMTTDRNVTVVNLYPGATIGHDVYGGGRGQKADNTTQPATQAVEAVVYGNVTVYQMGSILKAEYSNEGLATGGRIFGGNNVNGTPKGHILVYVEKTTGTTGQQRSSNDDRADADATHTYELAAVYGGGNEAEYNPYEDDPDDPKGFAEVIINGCNDVSIHSVYGGGNAASTPATLVTIDGAYEIEFVFGGGNGAGTGNPGANVGYHAYGDDHAGITQADIDYRKNNYLYGTGVATTNIYGGRIHHIYGGSNTRGNVRETAVAMLDEVNDCPLVVDGIYGGGREAYMEGGASLELGCITQLTEIYGGSEKADVGSSVELTITSGHFDRVFGGNNKSGKILGSITVNIEQTGCVPITIDELYLGGNNAPYSVYGYYDGDEHITEHNVGTEQNPEIVKHHDLKHKEDGNQLYNDPVLNIRSFKSIGTVFGGGKGEYATMVGDPTVDINVTHGWVNGEYVGTVTELTQYKGAPAQLTEDGVIGTVFGGGNAAKVEGSPQVKIGDRMGDDVELSSMRNLFESIGDQQNIVHGDIRITKDGTTGVTYTNKNDGTKTLTETISQTVNGATISGNVYGGGNEADVTGSTSIQLGPTK